MDAEKVVWLQKKVFFQFTTIDFAITHKLAYEHSFQKFANDNVHTMKRLNALNCTQCRRIDFAKEFCDRSAHKCFPYDRSSQVSYFLDTHHMNLMGALKVAPQLRLLAGLNATKLS